MNELAEHTFAQLTLDLWRDSRSKTVRDMLTWAEEEIIIPSGKFKGQRFRSRRQPYARAWLELVSNPWWSECVATGPSQSGKTLCCFVIPCLYHLFEMQQDVIAAVPSEDIVKDKWTIDLLPVIEASQYRHLLPKANMPRSKVISVQFENGSTLRFMTSGGRDKARAAFTAPVVCMTETDGFDIRQTTSEEGNMIQQIEARMASFTLEEKRIYKECTVTVKEGHTWQRYEAGTHTKLMLPCPHCQKPVLPGRDDLKGWQEAENEVDAESSSYYCPDCGEAWSESDRRTANENYITVHDGQSVTPDGYIEGESKQTRTLGFRWSATHNLLVDAGTVASQEWNAERDEKEDEAERKMCQFVWCIPYESKDRDAVDLTADDVVRSQWHYGRGQIPPGSKWVTMGVDVGKRVLHWTAIAWTTDGRGHIFDYGTTGVDSDNIGFELAISKALRHLKDKLGTGWVKFTSDTDTEPWDDKMYQRVHIDARWEGEEVAKAITALGDTRWKPFQGQGIDQWKKKKHSQPRRATKKGQAQVLGNEFYEAIHEEHQVLYVYGNSNYWKTWLHKRVQLGRDEDEQPKQGTVTLFSSTKTTEHREFGSHLTAEKQVDYFEPGTGDVTVWERIRSQNHWLDSTYMACVAAYRVGFRTAKHKRMRGTRTAAARPQRNYSEPRRGAVRSRPIRQMRITR
jgi:hypothetical protein